MQSLDSSLASNSQPSSSLPSSAVEPSAEYFLPYLEFSLRFSKQLYQRTGISNDTIENKAQAIQDVLKNLTNALDSRIDSTQKRLSSAAQVVIDTTSNLWVVRKTNDASNAILNELETQVASLESFFEQKFNGSPKQLAQSSDEHESQQQKSVLVRISSVVHSLNHIGFLFSEYYKQEFLQLRGVNTISLQFDQVTLQARKAKSYLEAVVEVVLGTVIYQHIVTPIFSQVKVSYSKASDSVTVVVQNVKKAEVQKLLASAKQQYKLLYEASISAVKGNRLTFTFAREAFEENAVKVQENLQELIKDVQVLRDRFVQQAVNLYHLSVEEIRRKQEEKFRRKEQLALPDENALEN